MELNQSSLNQQKNKEKKPLKKTITGNASIKKQSTGKRFFDELMGNDKRDLKEFFLFDLLAPTLKDIVVDFGKKFLDLIFYGRTGVRKSGNGSPSYISYSSYNQQQRRSDRPSRGRRINELDSIEFENRADAENVVVIINELIDQYGEADVGDLYELIGVTGNGYVDRNFGWRTPFNYDISYYHGSWILHLPRVVELN